jgi:ABC-type transporter Mla subunit MlaD
LVGARVVELVQVTGAPAASLRGSRNDTQFPVFPYTSSADVTAVTGKIDDILAKVQQVPIVEIGSDVRQITSQLSALLGAPELKDSLVHLDSTLKQIDQAATEVRPKIGPLIDNLNHAADQVQALATSANAVVSGDGAAQDASLPGTLRELNDTARSLRALADYLGRHPDALIKGKASQK